MNAVAQMGSASPWYVIVVVVVVVVGKRMASGE